MGNTLPSDRNYIVTPQEPWSYAQVINVARPLDHSSTRRLIEYTVEVELSVESGAIGVFLSDHAIGSQRTPETIVTVGTCEIVSLTVAADQDVDLVVRNGPLVGPSRGTLLMFRVIPRFEVDLTGSLERALPMLLRSPGRSALEEISSFIGDITADNIGRIVSNDPLPHPIELDRILVGQAGEIVLSELERMTDLLLTYDETKLDKSAGYGDRAYVARYLRQSSIRVYHLLKLFEEMKFQTGRILEVGAFIGTFALPLRRYGFEVTVIDRSRCARAIRRGDFYAVIEHIPHTPRIFLNAIASHVAPGGILAIDTPNLARYWNRVAMSQGRSVLQPIEKQFYSEIPFGGHHREFTLSELLWMFNQVGASEVRHRLFDYNVLQFTELYRDHFDAILAMTIDPTLADTLLVAGRLG